MGPMTEMMTKNLVMFVPQTLLMSWISYTFSGFILIQLPFPLPLRFKSMLQAGISTPDLDVSWVSSISWYFLNLFGLQSLLTLLLGETTSTGMNMGMQSTNPMAQPSEINKLFKAESESLQLTDQTWELEDVETRLLSRFTSHLLPDKKTV